MIKRRERVDGIKPLNVFAAVARVGGWLERSFGETETARLEHAEVFLPGNQQVGSFQTEFVASEDG